MKKMLALILMFCLVVSAFAITGCDSDGTSDSTRKKPTTTAAVITTTNNKQTTTAKPVVNPVGRTDGVINEARTEKVCEYEIDPTNFEVGTKQERTITFKGTIKIGNTAATTGAFAVVGVPFNTGIEAYINKINFRGGVGGDFKNGKQGYYIEFIHYDDGFQADTGSAYTKKLVEEDKIFAFVGHFGSPTVGATINYIKQTGVVACYFASGVGTLFNVDADSVANGSTLFPVQPIYTTEGRIMVGRALQQYPDAKKIGIVYTSDEAGSGIREGAEAQIKDLGNGYECVFSEVSTDTTTFTPAVTKVSDCDVIIIGAVQKGTVGVLKAMISNGVYKPVFTSYSVASAQTLLEIKADYDKLSSANKFPIYTNGWLSSTDAESFIEFATDIIVYTGENTLTVNSYAMAGWIAASIFCEGVERVVKSGENITNLTFVEAMESEKVKIKMATYAMTDSFIDYSNGIRIGTTTMSLLKNNAACSNFEEAAEMADFMDFLKSADINDIP